MILSSKYVVNMEKKYQKILYLYHAVNNTFVIMTMPGRATDNIVHMDANGKILFEFTFPKYIDSFGMINDYEAIVCETRLNRVTILNLLTHQFRYITHYFKYEESDQVNIMTFADTKLYCVQENGRYNENHFKLTYYHDGDEQPYHIWAPESDEWTYQYIIRKANNHSMICWFKARHDEQWEFRTYDLRDNSDGKFNIFRYKQEVGKPYGMPNIQVAINTMWEMTANVFLIVCISSKTDLNALNAAGICNNNFVCDTNSGVIRQANFWFAVQHNDYLIDQHYIGRFCMFRTYGYEDGKVLRTPVYYINNQQEQIIDEQSWECSYLYKYYFPGYDGNMYFECQFENGQNESFVCTVKKIVDQQQLTVHFLTQLDIDIDDDLVREVVQSIDYKAR